MSQSGRVRLLALFVLAVVFGSGTILGISIGRQSVFANTDTDGSIGEDSSAGNEGSGEAGTASDDSDQNRRSSLVYRIELSERQLTQMDSVMVMIGTLSDELDDEWDRARAKLWNERFDDVYDAARDSLYDVEFRERFDEMFQNARVSIRSLLTAEQVEEYDRLLEERSNRRRGGGRQESGNDDSGQSESRSSGEHSDSEASSKDGSKGRTDDGASSEPAPSNPTEHRWLTGHERYQA